jgi:cysteine-rich repeat protein
MRIRHLVPALLAPLVASCSDAPPPDPLPVGWTDVPRSEADEGVVVLPDPVASSLAVPRDASLPEVARSEPATAIDAMPEPAAELDARPAPTQEPADARVGRSCLQARACWRKAPENASGCLDQASHSARALSDAVLGCETGVCYAECRSTSCEACLLARCSLAFEACARASGCGDGVADPETEQCDDGNAVGADGCTNACTLPRPDAGIVAIEAGPASFCGDGVVDDGEACDDGNDDPFDGCSHCLRSADHVLISEIVVRPSAAEMIELYNPTALPVDIAFYALSDSAAYWQVAAGTFPTVAGTDFAARFPDGSWIMPGAYVTVAIGSAASFAAVYGHKPDYELSPGASDDPAVPDMLSLLTVSSIGTNAGLTDTGEPIVLFRARAEQPVDDIDYVFYGKPSTSNAAVDKTAAVVSGVGYLPETPSERQAFAPTPGDGSALYRCVFGEALEGRGGNGLSGHDETSERWVETFAVGKTRTPGGPPPSGACP